MSTIKVPTTFNIDVEFEIPEFYRRLLAWLLDMVVQFFYLKIAGEIFKAIMQNVDPFNEDTGYDLAAIGLLLCLPIFIYHIILEITMNGQSLGKKVLGIRVVNENGGRASISQFMIRWLLRISDGWIVWLFFALLSGYGWGNPEAMAVITIVFVFLVVDIVLVVSSKKGQRIGDMLARTILIRTSSRASIEETVFQEVADTYTPVFPQIMQLSDRDINAIKSILETARKSSNFHIAESASDRIKSHLRIECPLSPLEFLEVLLKDYNYLSTK